MEIIFSRRLYGTIPREITIKLNEKEYAVYFDTQRILSLNDFDMVFVGSVAGEFNYFCYNKSKKVTCWPTKNGIQPVTDDGRWRKEGRQEIKPSKFLELLKELFIFYDVEAAHSVKDESLNEKLWLRLLELFTAKIKAVNSEIPFEISSEVSKVYNMPTSENAGVWLKNSCMRPESGHDCRNFSHFYDLIPDCSILYGKDDSGLIFRALLWDVYLEKKTNKMKFLDRIYGDETIQEYLISVAEENGWIYRTFDSSSLYLNGTYLSDTIYVDLPDKAINYLKHKGSPYMDTLSWLDEEDMNLNSYHGDYELRDPGGVPLGYECRCHACGDPLHEEDVIRAGDYAYCETCFDERFFICDRCGEIYCNESHAINYLCVDCARARGYEICDNCGEWTDNYESTIDGEIMCQDCIDALGYIYCDKCGELVRKDDMIHHEGEYYCENCYEKIKEEIQNECC